MADQHDNNPPAFDVRIEPSYAATLTSAQAEAEEREAIEALILRVPADERETVRRLLANPAMHPMRAVDPEVARLLGVIGSIRTARAADAVRRANKERERSWFRRWRM